MNSKNHETLIIVGVAIAAVVAAVVFAGRTNSSGVAFAAADPNSVAAVENGLSAQIASTNQLAFERTQLAAQTILGLANAQGGLLLGQLQANDALAATQAEAAAATQQTELQTAASTRNTQIASDAAVQVANSQSQASIAAANAQAAVENYAIGSQVSIANAQEHQQQQSSLWGNILGAIGGIFGFNSPSSANAGTGDGYVSTFGTPAPNPDDVFNYGSPIAIVQPALGG